LPCVFYPDYYGYPSNGYGYYPNSLAGKQATIDSLMDLHSAYIAGATAAYYLNDFSAPSANYTSGSASKSLIYQLEKGSSDVLAAVNFGTTPLTVSINLSGIPSGTVFTRIGGAQSSTNTFTTSGLTATFTVPARSYAAWQQGLTPLPVELVRFEANALPAHQALLNWQIALSNNLEKVQIERSFNGSAFDFVAELEARQTTYTDARIQQDQKKVYYRLKFMYADGSFDYSPLRTIRFLKDRISVQALPNPGNVEQVKLHVSIHREGVYNITITNTLGQVVSTCSKNFSEGTSSIPLPQSILPGTYFVIISGDADELATCQILIP
jgi:hypothetical protein